MKKFVIFSFLLCSMMSLASEYRNGTYRGTLCKWTRNTGRSSV